MSILIINEDAHKSVASFIYDTIIYEEACGLYNVKKDFFIEDAKVYRALYEHELRTGKISEILNNTNQLVTNVGLSLSKAEGVNFNRSHLLDLLKRWVQYGIVMDNSNQ